MNHEDKKHETPIMVAKRTGKKNIVALLMENGAKPSEDMKKTIVKNGKEPLLLKKTSSYEGSLQGGA